ncbi:homoserine O-acetyltransferase [Cristinia sonorae]|uniref:Homoserine O-acetyltransferase n=1 Tax=Cristinia sonorae TaxID=1940300 RepID=A0A8K0UQ18_9AGAR|nr:homoserine O-acetyltransferase [Cristinia sonorae]
MTSTFASLLEQEIHTVPSFTLESGRTLHNVPVAYKTWGKLNEARDNVMVICHAFTGSADVEDWWGPLMGKGKAFDPNRYFIFCGNVMGSPYGSASPVTICPETGKPYGPEFPATTIRDDVRLHKLVLDHLGVTSVAVVIGGSMGGMAVLEWPLCSPSGYVRHIIPIATSARHSAWCISWGEAQRQSIYSDPTYDDGYYSAQPASGLAAARMAALLTYRSRDSFESRFGRKSQLRSAEAVPTPPHSPHLSSTDDILAEHNDGSKNTKPRTPTSTTPDASRTQSPAPSKPPIFSAQSYLRYQGDKFTARFDANCYIHITRKLDTHDVSRGRQLPGEDEASALVRVLGQIPPRALVIGVQTDGLFTPNEQREIAEHIPDAELIIIPSPEGHDGFLLEFELINGHIMTFLRREFPELYRTSSGSDEVDAPEEGFDIKKTSLFGEAEADIARW